MALIHTPVAGYTGDGPGGLHFVDGAAETDDDAIIGYCRGAGYLIDGERTNALAPVVAAVDPRDVTTVRVGAPARDAAVHPRPGDYQPPVNAGQADPHGPEVRAPGLLIQEQTEPTDEPQDANSQVDTSAPALSASVADWRAWVIASVVDNDPEVHAEVGKATKAELIKQYGPKAD
ncbi:hypothetical protein [Streptomyces sp. CB03911]|uniref:hypothetical protein n=1 Tax=Streptomyces sp. CB03911 TaxID=1804758 RepID=UPI0009393316|nr:hypothetical protein [Streptomyces sp. CB03911]OKI22209.1 hypothetical protein A6A07_34610 [Streptomyces sp. CB03911]